MQPSALARPVRGPPRGNMFRHSGSVAALDAMYHPQASCNRGLGTLVLALASDKAGCTGHRPPVDYMASSSKCTGSFAWAMRMRWWWLGGTACPSQCWQWPGASGQGLQGTAKVAADDSWCPVEKEGGAPLQKLPLRNRCKCMCLCTCSGRASVRVLRVAQFTHIRSLPPPLVLAMQKSQIDTVPTPTVAWTRA